MKKIFLTTCAFNSFAGTALAQSVSLTPVELNVCESAARRAQNYAFDSMGAYLDLNCSSVLAQGDAALRLRWDIMSHWPSNTLYLRCYKGALAEALNAGLESTISRCFSEIDTAFSTAFKEGYRTCYQAGRILEIAPLLPEIEVPPSGSGSIEGRKSRGKIFDLSASPVWMSTVAVTGSSGAAAGCSLGESDALSRKPAVYQ